jgi:hypothetical protein
MEPNATAELLTGLLVSQLVLARELERKGLLSQKEYADALQHWIDSQPQETRSSERYVPLHHLIRRLQSEGSRIQ